MTTSEIIKRKLEKKLGPSYLEIINDSHKHHVPKGSESHFQIIIVSENFEGLSLIEQHQLVYQILREELSEKIHALSISSHTPSQWDKRQETPQTPNCQKKKPKHP